MKRLLRTKNLEHFESKVCTLYRESLSASVIIVCVTGAKKSEGGGGEEKRLLP